MANATPAVDRVGVGTKLAFGVGSAGQACAHIGFTSFNMVYYANVLGVSGTLVGTAVLIALIFDAISDPLVGSISDRFRSQLGRRHPFMYVSALPLGLCFMAIYHPPAGLGEMGLFTWLCVFTILLRQSLTLFDVPHLALGAELSRDYQQRSAVMAYHALFQVVGGAGVAFLGWGWLGKAPGGAGNASNFTSIGLFAGVFITVVVLLSAQGTRAQIPRLARVPADLERLTFKVFWSEVLSCLRNRNYVMLLLGLLFLSATMGVREALFGHVNLFFWELPEAQIKLFHLATPPAYLIAFIVVPQLHHKLEKRTTIIAAVAICTFCAIVPVGSRLLGLLPENGDPALPPILIGFFGLFYFGIAMLTISVMSALADVTDEHALRHGRAQEGIFYSARTFFQKAAGGLGMFFGGIALDVISFPAGAKPGDVNPDQVLQLGIVDGIISALPLALAFYYYGKYSITRDEHRNVLEQLKKLRSKAAVPVDDAEPAAVLREATDSV